MDLEIDEHEVDLWNERNNWTLPDERARGDGKKTSQKRCHPKNESGGGLGEHRGQT